MIGTTSIGPLLTQKPCNMLFAGRKPSKKAEKVYQNFSKLYQKKDRIRNQWLQIVFDQRNQSVKDYIRYFRKHIGPIFVMNLDKGSFLNQKIGARLKKEGLEATVIRIPFTKISCMLIHHQDRLDSPTKSTFVHELVHAIQNKFMDGPNYRQTFNMKAGDAYIELYYDIYWKMQNKLDTKPSDYRPSDFLPDVQQAISELNHDEICLIRQMLLIERQAYGLPARYAKELGLNNADIELANHQAQVIKDLSNLLSEAAKQKRHDVTNTL